MNLGDLQQLTMLAVARLGADAYADAVRRELLAVADRDVAVATVHVTLVRLEDRGMVASEKRGSPPKRYFALTPEGREALDASWSALRRMWDGMAPT